MFFNFKYKIKLIRLRQISNFDKKKLKEIYNSESEKEYNWDQLKNRIKRIGIVKELKVIETNQINEWGEIKYTIIDGIGIHRLYFLYIYFKPEDYIKVYSRQRNQTELDIYEMTIEINNKIETFKKKLKINKPNNLLNKLHRNK